MAETRRELSPDDAFATTLDKCADELDLHLDGLRERFNLLTPEQFGSVHGVTRVTVVNWIRGGDLEAYGNSRDGWLIPAHAERTRRAS